MPRRAFVFTFGDALPADDPVARWATCLAMAWNDVVFTHDLYTEHDEGGRDVYLVRVAAAHLSEAFVSDGPFAAGYDDWPDVQTFVGGLPKKARENFEWLRLVAADRATEGTLGWRLEQMRNQVFHYPHLQTGQSSGRRLELTRVLRTKASEEGSISFDDDTVKGARLSFADEIAITLALARADIDSSDRSEFSQFVVELLDAQQRFMRFGEIAIDRYLRLLPDGTLRPE